MRRLALVAVAILATSCGALMPWTPPKCGAGTHAVDHGYDHLVSTPHTTGKGSARFTTYSTSSSHVYHWNCDPNA